MSYSSLHKSRMDDCGRISICVLVQQQRDVGGHVDAVPVRLTFASGKARTRLAGGCAFRPYEKRFP